MLLAVESPRRWRFTDPGDMATVHNRSGSKTSREGSMEKRSPLKAELPMPPALFAPGPNALALFALVAGVEVGMVAVIVEPPAAKAPAPAPAAVASVEE